MQWNRSVWTGVLSLMIAIGLAACAENQPSAGSECDENTSCETGHKCIDGTCEVDDTVPEPTRNQPPSSTPEPTGKKYTETCTSDSECAKDLSCIQTPEGKAICTRRCPPDGGNQVCNQDSGELAMECLGIRPDAGDIVHVCLPRPKTQCHLCTREGDDLTGACGTVGLDLCWQQDDGGYRCTISCADGLTCPAGSTCESIEEIDGSVYDVCVPNTGYCQKCVDEDGDGYGNPAFDMSECDVPNVPDCDDNDPYVNPGMATQCNGKDDACQGRIDDEYRNADGAYATLAHCGACNQPCELEHAIAECSTGVCNFVACEPGWLNIRGTENTEGCPYQCTPRTDKDEDRPSDLRDPAYGQTQEDYNCDGIDGDASRAYFVAKSGSDNNPGTRDKPFKTIDKALGLLRVMSTEIDQIYVSQGDYTENLTLVDGISIYGGFDAGRDWERNIGYQVTIRGAHVVNGNRIGLRGQNLNGDQPTILQNLTVIAADAHGYVPGTLHGTSSYGIHCTNCSSLILQGIDVYAGRGVDGSKGDSGPRASATRPSSCHGPNGQMAGSGQPADGPAGGEGFQCNGPYGISDVWTPSGGKGGDASHDMGGAGGDGQTNVNGQPVGKGGAGAGTGCNSRADDGTRGTNGATGGRGQGGKQPSTIGADGFYTPTTGTRGLVGAAGTGGGGGGGGATHGATLPARRHSGGPGGAGGAGGCPGAGGSAGGNGGSSIALTLISSTGATIDRTNLYVMEAGNGGDGGMGGAGQPGCNGGFGDTGATANQCSRAGGDGGDGKAGGTGGSGGKGGGGAGGSVLGILTKGTTLQTEGVTVLLPTTAGKGAATSQPQFNGEAGRKSEHLAF